MLKQSKQSLIILKGLKIVSDRSPETTKILKNNLHRVRQLGLTFESCHHIAEWAIKVLNPEVAPMLKKLELDVQRGPRLVHTIPVPDMTLSTQSLTILNCPLEFPVKHIQGNISFLRIDLPCNWLSSRNLNAVDYLHQTLSVMPALTRLHISIRNLIHPYPYSSYSGCRVPLPCLETLRYTGIVDFGVHILQLLELPSTVRFDICIADQSDYRLSLMYPIISQILHRRREISSMSTTDAFGIRFLTHADTGFGPITNRVSVFQSVFHPDYSSSVTNSGLPTHESAPILSLQIQSGCVWDGQHWTAPVPLFLWKILNVFSPCSVEYVSMHSNVRYNMDRGAFDADLDSNHYILSRFAFLTCPGIKSLFIADACTAECIIPFLGIRRANTGDTGSTSSVVPNDEFFAFTDLETLVTGDWSPADSSEGFEPGTATRKAVMDRVMQKIRFAVEERAQAGKRLKRLAVHAVEGEALGEWIGQARSLGWVGDIVLDGKSYEDFVLRFTAETVLDGDGDD